MTPRRPLVTAYGLAANDQSSSRSVNNVSPRPHPPRMPTTRHASPVTSGGAGMRGAAGPRELADVPIFGGDGLPDRGARWVATGELAGTVCVTLPAAVAIEELTREWMTGVPMTQVRSLRRRVELGLIVLAVIITASAYGLAGLGTTASLPADIVGFLVMVLALLVAAHLAVRRFARNADGLILLVLIEHQSGARRVAVFSLLASEGHAADFIAFVIEEQHAAASPAVMLVFLPLHVKAGETAFIRQHKPVISVRLNNVQPFNADLAEAYLVGRAFRAVHADQQNRKGQRQ